jgi:fumarate hydratase class I
VIAKQQLFRTLDDVNPDPVLAKLETEVMEEANKIGVGAMGFGGKASLIGCKVAAANRLPASFFVSVAYDCWAFRDARGSRIPTDRSRDSPGAAS